MEEKKDALVPTDQPQDPLVSQVERDYQQAREYFKDSMVQAAKTNAALLTVLGLFMVRGARYAWEGLRGLFPAKK